jgi:hypothetical protein
MKKIFILFLLTLSFQNAYTCDICGCSSGNYFIGPFPQFNKHFFGMRYSYRSFNTVLKSDNNQFSKDFYQTVELWGGLQLGSKWQLIVFAPYNINHSVTDDGNKKNSGLSDITIIANYNLLNKKYLNKDTETVSQQLWLGGGIKVPSGKFVVDTSALVASANNQPGTGSFDFLISLTYSYQIMSWGINCNLNYKINQEAENFKFGNRFSAAGFIYRSIHISDVTFSPNIGFLYENLAPNISLNKKVEDTGGNDLLSALGIETRYGKIGVGFNVQLPLYQNLSNSQTNTKIKGMMHLSYMF